MLLKLKADVVLDTDSRQVVFNINKQDAEQLASQLNQQIMRGGGIPGMRNMVVKSLIEGKIMNWVRILMARGWVDLWGDGENWRITVKKGV
jgi:hypothetical protein